MTIKLSENTGFTIIPEGEHIFKVEDVEYDKDFGVIEIHYITKNGMKHKERFNLIGNDGEINQGALNAFSYTARVLMNDFTLKEIDHRDLVGRYMKAEVKHNIVPSSKDPSKNLTFVNLGDKYPADGFEDDSNGDSNEEDVSLDDLLS